MKLLLTAILAMPVASALADDSGTDADTKWKTVAETPLVRVAVERTLYEARGGKYFHVRFRVTNRTDRPLGLPLADDGVLYPNQWGVHRRPVREIIDESRIAPTGVSAEEHARITGEFAKGRLVRIEPRKSVDYFRRFNGNAQRPAIDREKTGWLMLSVDGELPVTDGERVESVHVDWDDPDRENPDVPIRLPIEWRLVPKGARIVGER